METMEAIIARVIRKHLWRIYCDNCAHEGSYARGKDDCDDCNRKAMGWDISDACVEGIAKEIIKELPF